MVVRRATTMHLVDTLAFVAEVAERLEEDPVFGEYKRAEHISVDSRKRQLKIHGFTELDESDGTISLVIGRWVDDSEPPPLLTNDVAQLRSWLENFAVAALSGNLDERIASSSEACDLANVLRERKSSISCIRFHIFSNQALSQRFRKEFRSSIDGITTETHIWDLQRLMALYSSDRERELVQISLSDFKSTGIPCIEASKADGLKSYLCVIEGDVLADLFDRYGSRLLEGNVRSFLGIKGKVNKGIRGTIKDTPGLFFAYNNGIAATAASVKITATSDAQVRISGISDLQIVNGGQTTASVLRARKQDGLSLAGVTIPMKLTVVGNEQAHDLIPKIAEFANTQNKVAVDDFFANHPFHRKMEEISRRLLVPARAGVRVQSKWFYERSRGQYQNQRLYLLKSKKDAFDIEFPARQVINKTELAKYDSVLGGKPHWASLGATKNFIKFAGQFSPKGEKAGTEYWTEISPNFGEDYYQRIVGMATLWAAGEQVVAAGKGGWYKGDYRPQIVAYAWSLVFQRIRESGCEPHIMRAWERQASDSELDACFQRAAVVAQKALLEVPVGSSNVGEWAKTEACWTKVSSLNLNLGGATENWAKPRDEAKRERIEERRKGAQDDAILLQKEIIALAKSGYWKALYEWDPGSLHVMGPERDLLMKAVTVQSALRIALDKDWRRLIDLKRRCEGEGFRFARP